MIRQVMNGRTINTVNVKATAADLTALKSILVGQLIEFEVKGEGGTPFPMPPEGLNAKKFSVGSKELSGQYISASVSIPHVKKTKAFHEIQAHAITNFDASYDIAKKVEYCNAFYDKYNVAPTTGGGGSGGNP